MSVLHEQTQTCHPPLPLSMGSADRSTAENGSSLCERGLKMGGFRECDHVSCCPLNMGIIQNMVRKVD